MDVPTDSHANYTRNIFLSILDKLLTISMLILLFLPFYQESISNLKDIPIIIGNFYLSYSNIITPFLRLNF